MLCAVLLSQRTSRRKRDRERGTRTLSHAAHCPDTDHTDTARSQPLSGSDQNSSGVPPSSTKTVRTMTCVWAVPSFCYSRWDIDPRAAGDSPPPPTSSPWPRLPINEGATGQSAVETFNITRTEGKPKAGRTRQTLLRHTESGRERRIYSGKAVLHYQSKDTEIKHWGGQLTSDDIHRKRNLEFGEGKKRQKKKEKKGSSRWNFLFGGCLLQ